MILPPGHGTADWQSVKKNRSFHLNNKNTIESLKKHEFNQSKGFAVYLPEQLVYIALNITDYALKNSEKFQKLFQVLAQT